MLKKLLWTAWVAVTSSVAAGLAYRAAAEVWRRVYKEDPPGMPGWSRFLVRRPLMKRIAGLLGAESM